MLKRLFYFFLLAQITACAGLFYYPTDRYYFDPEKYFNVSPEEHWLDIGENKIHSWLFRTKEKRQGVILYFHGNAENLTSHYSNLVWVLAKGYDFLIFDYPGFGLSSGKPNPEENLKVGHEVLRWLYSTVHEPIVIYGQSLGGNIALRTALDMRSEIPIKAVVIDSAFNSYPAIAKEKMNAFWLTWPFQWIPNITLNDKYSPQNISSLAPIPVMFFHCKGDPVVNSIYSSQMFEQAAEPKKLILIDKCNHGATFYAEKGKYRQDFLEFIDKN